MNRRLFAALLVAGGASLFAQGAGSAGTDTLATTAATESSTGTNSTEASVTTATEERTWRYDDLVLALYANNSDILRSAEEYYRSRLDVKDAWAALGPTVSASASGTYMFNPPSVQATIDSNEVIDSLDWPEDPVSHTSMRPTASEDEITVDQTMDKTLYSFSLSLQQPVFTWGKIANSISLYSTISRARQIQLIRTQRQLETELKSRLTALYYLSQIMATLDEQAGYAAQLVAYSEAAERSGVLVHQDVLEARLKAKQIEIARQDVLDEQTTQRIELEKLTHISDLDPARIDFVPDEQELALVLEGDRDRLNRLALSDWSDTMLLVEQAQRISDIAVKISKGSVNWKPDIALQLSLGYGGSKVPFVEQDWRDADDYTFNVSVGIATTVWDGGSRVRDVSRRLSQSRTAAIDVEDARSQIKGQLEQQWSTIDGCTVRIEYQALKIEAAALKIEQQEAVFKSGYGSQSDVLDAQISLCNERLELQQQTLKRAISCLVILFLAGR